tara:strand:- start:655 stop:1917 length:1263 start_codon:yes stop_codon:yes gene_type:complete
MSDSHESDKLIKILFYSDVILNNIHSITNTTTNNNFNNNNFNNDKNILKRYYNNNILSINIDDIKHMKNTYSFNDRNLSDFVTYMFINNIFEYPWNKIIIKETYINKLSNILKNTHINMTNDTHIPIDELKKKISENINISYDCEQLYNPSKNIIGYIQLDNIYDDIIYYTSEHFLLKYEPLLKKNIYSYDILSNIINNIITDNIDITSFNIKKYINVHKNINYNINMTLPIFIINHFKPKKIININNDYGQWLYASNLLNIDKLISINQYKIDDMSIDNINNLFEKNIYYKYVDNSYMYDDYDIDLIYYNCDFLHEHSINNYKNIVYNEYFYNINLTWKQLKYNGHLLIFLHDTNNKKITEIINLYIDNINESEYIGVLYVYKQNSLLPIWVFKKTQNYIKNNHIINSLYNEKINLFNK